MFYTCMCILKDSMNNSTGFNFWTVPLSLHNNEILWGKVYNRRLSPSRGPLPNVFCPFYAFTNKNFCELFHDVVLSLVQNIVQGFPSVCLHPPPPSASLCLDLKCHLELKRWVPPVRWVNIGHSLTGVPIRERTLLSLRGFCIDHLSHKLPKTINSRLRTDGSLVTRFNTKKIEFLEIINAQELKPNDVLLATTETMSFCCFCFMERVVEWKSKLVTRQLTRHLLPILQVGGRRVAVWSCSRWLKRLPEVTQRHFSSQTSLSHRG